MTFELEQYVLACEIPNPYDSIPLSDDHATGIWRHSHSLDCPWASEVGDLAARGDFQDTDHIAAASENAPAILRNGEAGDLVRAAAEFGDAAAAFHVPDSHLAVVRASDELLSARGQAKRSDAVRVTLENGPCSMLVDLPDTGGEVVGGACKSLSVGRDRNVHDGVLMATEPQSLLARGQAPNP